MTSTVAFVYRATSRSGRFGSVSGTRAGRHGRPSPSTMTRPLGLARSSRQAALARQRSSRTCARSFGAERPHLSCSPASADLHRGDCCDRCADCRRSSRAGRRGRFRRDRERRILHERAIATTDRSQVRRNARRRATPGRTACDERQGDLPLPRSAVGAWRDATGNDVVHRVRRAVRPALLQAALLTLCGGFRTKLTRLEVRELR